MAKGKQEEPVVLPAEVIEEDREREEAAGRSNALLMQHRWHWTLDETNDGRVSLREYARQVERAYSAIARDANGYELMLADPEMKPTEARYRAGMTADRAIVTDAIAEARGVAFTTVKDKRRAEVRRVLEAAQSMADTNNTTVAEEAPALVASVVEKERRHLAREAVVLDIEAVAIKELEKAALALFKADKQPVPVIGDVRRRYEVIRDRAQARLDEAPEGGEEHDQGAAGAMGSEAS